MCHGVSVPQYTLLSKHLANVHCNGHSSGSRPLASAMLAILDPRWDPSQISYYFPVSQRSCSFASAGLVPSPALATSGDGVDGGVGQSKPWTWVWSLASQLPSSIVLPRQGAGLALWSAVGSEGQG